jgi:hypothetical protein
VWCFVDESWHNSGDEHVGVLAAVLGTEKAFINLDSQMFKIRRKYYGEEHARNLSRELKGISLFANNSFKMLAKHGYSKNLSVAHEIFSWVQMHSPQIRTITISVYGKRKPPLLASDPKHLSRPFKELCLRVLAGIPKGERCQMVFDQRVGAQEDIAISVMNYLAGMKQNHQLNACPLMGVSNTIGGLQFADLVAYVLGRYNSGDKRFLRYYRMLNKLQFHGKNTQEHNIHGFVRLQWDGNDGYAIRKVRVKK